MIRLITFSVLSGTDTHLLARPRAPPRTAAASLPIGCQLNRLLDRSRHNTTFPCKNSLSPRWPYPPTLPSLSPSSTTPPPHNPTLASSTRPKRFSTPRVDAGAQ